MKFNSMNDLRELEADLMQTPLNTKRSILAASHKVGLLRLPWYVPYRSYFTGLVIKGIMSESFTSERVDSLWNNFVNHIVRGRDTTKQNDVGGFNENEFEILLELLEAYGWQR